MAEYYLVRVYQLNAGASAREVERLAETGLAEMQRWIPGATRLSLLRLGADEATEVTGAQATEAMGEAARYALITCFASREAYRRWRLVEAEGADFWERYASIIMQWEQLSRLIDEYAGEIVVDVLFQHEALRS